MEKSAGYYKKILKKFSINYEILPLLSVSNLVAYHHVLQLKINNINLIIERYSMKIILPILSFVFIISFASNAQSETDVKTEQTKTTVQSTSVDQTNLSASEVANKNCEGKSKEECKKQCEGKAEYHKSKDDMSEHGCKPGCEKECCSNSTEKVKQTEESSEQK